MKRSTILFAALALGALTFHSMAEQSASTRRFTTRDGKTFYASVTGKNDLAVMFKLQSGAQTTMSIRDLSVPDQLFVRKWTKFKDELMNNAQFSKLAIKDMLELRGYQSFEFDITGNHIFLDAEVNGKAMRLMVDTGADSSLFHIDSAKDAGVEVGPMDQVIHGVGGNAPAAVCKVQTIKLGDAVIENRKLLAADLFKNDPGGKGSYDGILGADFLRELDAVISYREGRMFLKPDNLKPANPNAKPVVYAEWKRWTTADGKQFSAALVDKTDTQASFRMQDGKIYPWPLDKLSDNDKDIVSKWDKLHDVLAKSPEWRTLTVKELLELRGYESFAYRSSGNHILVDGAVGDTPATFIIDTGAYSGLLHIDFSKKAKLEIGPMDQLVHGIGGSAPAALTQVPLLKMGEVVIKNRTLLSCDMFKDMGIPGGTGDHDGLFGADFLRELDGVISYKEGRIFLRPDISDKPGEKEGDAKKDEAKPADAPKPSDAPKPAEPAKPAPKPVPAGTQPGRTPRPNQA